MPKTAATETTPVNDMARVCSPTDTLSRILPRIREFGISRLADVTGLDRIGIPVMLAIRPNSRSIAISQGKGSTPDQARVSALMEAIEIWHAERILTPVRYASVSDLEQAGRVFVSIDLLPATPAGAVPRNVRMHWMAAQDLIGGTEKLVPYEMVHADYTHPVAHEAGYFAASTNGLASGNHRLEAICHAVCEVVERDALSVWHHMPPSEQAKRQIDPNSLKDPALNTTLHRFLQAGLEVRIWDITTDIRIPSYLCLALDRRADLAHPGLGSGSHADPVIAMQRALNEAAQTRLNYISGAREDLCDLEYDYAGLTERTAYFESLPTAKGHLHQFDKTIGLRARSLEEMLDMLIAQLQAIGISEIAVADLTHPAHDMPVVRVIIPGLEAPHDDAAYVPGPRAKAAGVAA